MVAQQASILRWGGASFSVTKAKSLTMMKQFYLPLPCLDPASADMHPFLPFLNPFTRSFVTAIQFFNARWLFLDGLSCLYMKTPSPPIVLEVSIYHSCLCPSFHYSSTLVQPPFVGWMNSHLGFPLFSLHWLLCLHCLNCPTDVCCTFQTRSDVHCSCWDCSFHHHLVECVHPCWIQDNNSGKSRSVYPVIHFIIIYQRELLQL